MDSAKLSELPALVGAFGVDAVSTALNSGAIKIHHTAIALADRNVNEPMHYRLVHVSEVTTDPGNWARKLRGMFSGMPQLTLYQREKLKNALQRASLATPEALGRNALGGWKRDLYKNNELLVQAVAQKAREVAGGNVPPFAVRVHPIDEQEGIVRVETDLALPASEKHKVVWLGIAAIGNINFRIEQMRSFEAVCGFRDEESSLVDAKLSFLLDALHDGTQEKQLRRVLEVSDLPDLGDAASRREVDLVQLLRGAGVA